MPDRLPRAIFLSARTRSQVESDGFSPFSGIIEIRSALPAEYKVNLSIAALSTALNVTGDIPLLDPEQSGSANHLDKQAIADRPASLPGRSVVDLVDSQPGWLYEGNAVLHPRGSEYQTQFVVDGIPLTDNRSPSFGPEIEADDVDSLTIYTAGIPAEYGRKMGGVVEVNTLRDEQPGLHGEAVLSGGSFDTARRLRPGAIRLGSQHSRRQRHREHDGPLPQSRGAGKLHQPRHDRRLIFKL